MSPHADFTLCETNVAMLREISNVYGIDGSWIAWQYEKHAITKGSTPFRLSTNEYHSYGRIEEGIKEGIKEVTFEIDFSEENANVIRYIQFKEMPSNKHFIVTQTSMMHVQEGNTCCLWFELPQGATKGNMAAAQNLMEVKVCCDRWKDFLPSSPVTELEQAQLVFAHEDVTWLKKQAVATNNALLQLKADVGFKKIETTALKDANEKLLHERVALKAEIEKWRAETGEMEKQLEKSKAELDKEKAECVGRGAMICSLRGELEEMKALLGEFDSPPPMSTPIKRRRMTPAGRRAAVVPSTAPAASRAAPNDNFTTPTKVRTYSRESMKNCGGMAPP